MKAGGNRALASFNCLSRKRQRYTLSMVATNTVLSSILCRLLPNWLFLGLSVEAMTGSIFIGDILFCSRLNRYQPLPRVIKRKSFPVSFAIPMIMFALSERNGFSHKGLPVLSYS